MNTPRLSKTGNDSPTHLLTSSNCLHFSFPLLSRPSNVTALHGLGLYLLSQQEDCGHERGSYETYYNIGRRKLFSAPVERREYPPSPARGAWRREMRRKCVYFNIMYRINNQSIKSINSYLPPFPVLGSLYSSNAFSTTSIQPRTFSSCHRLPIICTAVGRPAIFAAS